MKTSNIALVLAAASLVACSSPVGDTLHTDEVRSSLGRDTAPLLTASELDELATDEADFAVDLYKAVRSAPDNAGKNVFLSPHSVSTALAMTYAGARGQTKAEMKKALHFGLPDDRLHRGFDWLDLALASRGQTAKGKDGKPFRVSIANSIWGQKGALFEAPFLDTLAVNYGAGLNVVDFASNPEAARKTINGWIDTKTESRIKEALPERSVNGAALVLVNTVYFNAAWASKFDKDGTAPAPFTRLDGSVAQVPMMHALTSGTRYGSDDAMEAIEMPYDGGETSMLVIAPTRGKFDAFESALTGSKVLDVLAGLQDHQVRLSFPKAKLEQRQALVEPLQQLGMRAAFADADFRGIASGMDLKITAVLHQTFLDIDESGTEAAAATEVIIGESSYREPPSIVTMAVDRPYIVAIVDRPTRTLMFLGRILEPKN